MEFVERFFPHHRLHCGLIRRHLRCRIRAVRQATFLNFVDISGQQLDLRVLKSLAAVIVHGDPSHHVEQVKLGGGFIRDHHVVVGVPVHPTAHIGKLGIKLSGFVGFEQPAQSRLENGIA